MLPHRHLQYVLENFIMSSKIKQIAIVPHSYGGECIMRKVCNDNDFRNRVKAVALTDSCHVEGTTSMPEDVAPWIRE